MPIFNLDEITSHSLLEMSAYRQSSLCVDEQPLRFSQALSAEILGKKRARTFPDVVSFAYFCRKSNVKRILSDLQNSHLRQGWGRLVHIAPSNIPVNFAFSLMMGVLSGNKNYVRIPSLNYPQIELIIESIQSVLNRDSFRNMADRITFFRCKKNSKALVEAVAQCEGLVVWGGDETVSYFRALPKKADAVELYFPNRVSCLVIDAEAVIDSVDKARSQLFNDFYNDTFLVDQNACSSPNIIYWVGVNETIKQAQEVFWSGFESCLEAKVASQTGMIIEKKLDLLRLVQHSTSHVQVEKYGPHIWLFENTELAEQKLRFGNFLQVGLSDVSDITPYLRRNEQTVTYFGVQPMDLAKNLMNSGCIVDRIVPVGQALEMGVHWDGKDILSLLSHEMKVT